MREHPLVLGTGFQLCNGGKDHISHQTGKRENHRLKSAFHKGEF